MQEWSVGVFTVDYNYEENQGIFLGNYFLEKKNDVKNIYKAFSNKNRFSPQKCMREIICKTMDSMVTTMVP